MINFNYVEHIIKIFDQKNDSSIDITTYESYTEQTDKINIFNNKIKEILSVSSELSQTASNNTVSGENLTIKDIRRHMTNLDKNTFRNITIIGSVVKKYTDHNKNLVEVRKKIDEDFLGGKLTELYKLLLNNSMRVMT